MAIEYDFIPLRTAIQNVYEDTSFEAMFEIQKELNEFFSDSKCLSVTYTNNTDKLFFGMIVMPVISGEQAVDILTKSKIERIHSYHVELDSKLFTSPFNANHILAILIYNISKIVNDTSALEKVRIAIDEYLTFNDEVLVINKCIQYRELLAFALKDSVSKFTSIFNIPGNEIIANQFMVDYDLNFDLEYAFNIIAEVSGESERVPSNKLVVLHWALRLYKDVKNRRISALKEIEESILLNPSVLEKKELTNIAREITKIDDDSLLTEFGESIKDIMKKMKYKGIRSLEDDLYEFNLRVKNVEGEEEAVTLMRDINSRMSIIDDYIRNECPSEADRDRFIRTYNKFALLREKLSQKSTSKYKYLGLYVEYPQV